MDTIKGSSGNKFPVSVKEKSDCMEKCEISLFFKEFIMLREMYTLSNHFTASLK